MSGGSYPLAYAFAYFFLCGHLLRQAFICLRLPGAVAILITGFLWSYFTQDEMLAARNELQLFAFFIVLLRAGLELELHYAAKARVILLVFFPAALELVAIALYAVYKLGWTPIQGLVLGCTLFPIGEGLVLPKMAEFQGKFPGHPLLKLMVAWAPLEATFALTTFGVLSGLSDPHRDEPATKDPGLLIGGAVLQIVLTIIVGSSFGYVTGVLTRHRQVVHVPQVDAMAAYAKNTKDKLNKNRVEAMNVSKKWAQRLSVSFGTNRSEDNTDVTAVPDATDVNDVHRGRTLSRDSKDSIGSAELDSDDVDELLSRRRKFSTMRQRCQSYDTFDFAATSSERFQRFANKPVFSGSRTESLLLLLSAALVALGLGEVGGLQLHAVPGMGLFQPELNVIVTGCSFAIGAGHELLEEVRGALDGVWVFGSIVLFGMIGSRTSLSVFKIFGDVAPIMVVGVVARGFGIYVCVLSQRLFRSQCRCRTCTRNTISAGFIDATFYFMCACARASVQGALGSIPTQQNFFSSDTHSSALQTFIASSSKLYIIVFALGGSVLMELVGPWLLEKSQDAHDVISTGGGCPVLTAIREAEVEAWESQILSARSSRKASRSNVEVASDSNVTSTRSERIMSDPEGGEDPFRSSRIVQV